MERKAPIIKEKIIMAKKILVVVDAQNDFITGALGNKECDVATNVIAEKIRSGKYDDVIFTGYA